MWSFSFRVLPFISVFAVGGLRFVSCVFVVGWRHDVRSGWSILLLISFHVLMLLSLFLLGAILSLKRNTEQPADWLNQIQMVHHHVEKRGARHASHGHPN